MTQPGFHHALKVGYQLHWYTIDKVLGQGGFGITYLAHDNNLDQRVAIKEFLPTEFAVRNEDDSIRPTTQDQSEMYHWALDRFITEARTLAKFDHPNIVRVMAVFEANDAAYIVMRYEEGETLEDLFKVRGILSESELLDILLPIIDGLEIVHQAGFIHRDIKPGNIFIRSDNSPVLIDFGSARQAIGAQTQTLTTLISPGYSPIEQYFTRGEDQGPWTDIYGLASTIYRGMAGKRPVDTMTRSKHILAGEADPYIPAIEAGQGRYSAAFLQAIDQGLEFRHQHRTQNLVSWKKQLTCSPDEQPAVSSEQTTVLAPAITEPTEPAQIMDEADAETIIRTSESQPAQATATGRKKWGWLILAVMIIIGFIVLKPLGTKKPVPDSDNSNTNRPLETAVENIPPEPTIEELPLETTVTNNGPTRLEQLLAQAEKDMQANRLTRPRGQNAFERYRKALTIDPDNQIAKDGMRTIIKRKMSIIEGAVKKKDFERAEANMNHLLDLVPNNQRLLKARDRIRRARRNKK